MKTNDQIEETCYNLVLASAYGQLFKVKKILDSNKTSILLNFGDGKPLQVAVANGRISVVQYLLDSGAEPFLSMNLVTACVKGFSRICQILCKRLQIESKENKEQILKESLFAAIENGRTTCVSTLLQTGTNVHFNDEEPLIMACEKEEIDIVRLLIKFGADVNARDGKPLIDACKTNKLDIVEILVKNEADVSIRCDTALLEAVKNSNILISILLINNGADQSVLQKTTLDDITSSILETFTKNNSIYRLQRAISDSFVKNDFKWQELCSVSTPSDSATLMRLKDQTLLFSDTDSNFETCGKRQLCKRLAEELDEKTARRKLYDDSCVDFSGVPINNLPFWKIFEIENHPFNCFDLFRMVRRGMKFNPFTKKELPLVELKNRENYLRRILTRQRFADSNFLEIIREPIQSDIAYLRGFLEKQVWDKLSYPPDISVVLDASDDIIDEMVDKLLQLSSEDRLSTSVSSRSVVLYGSVRRNGIYQ